MTRTLDVYLHDRLAGCLEQADSGDLTFTYAADYLDTAPHALSLSLPLEAATHSGNAVRAFFSGLLPEQSVRARLARCLGLSETNPFALLEAVGGDCAGALAFYPHGTKPPALSDDVEVLDDKALGEVLALIKRRPMLAGDDGYRFSLAGAQDKLAVGFREGRVALIKDGAPTTHILKPAIEGIKDSAHNELFCMRLAKIMGLDAPKTSLGFASDTPYYLVERYDRHTASDGTITHIHQEDFCQALGIAPEIKYEAEGEPSIAAYQQVINDHTARPAADQMKLLNRVLFNYLIGNADAHGKNFSLLYKGDKPELAPVYDLLSTAIYPSLAKNMAMKIGGQYEPQDVYPQQFYKLVPETKAARADMKKCMEKMVKEMLGVAPSLKASLGAEGLASDVFGDIITIIETRARNFG